MRILLFTLTTLFSFSNFSAQWVAKESLPYEVQTLVESFHMEYLTDEEKSDLKLQLQELDSLMTNLEATDRFFLAKSSIYKWILKYPPEVKPPADFTLDQFTSKVKSTGLNSFAKWLLLALKSDSIDIQRSPNYNQYLKVKTRKTIPFDLRSLHKKIDLLRPWAYLFYRNPGEQINLQLTRYQFSLLKDIVAQYKLYYRFKGSTLPAQQTKKLTLFSFQEKSNSNPSSKTIDDSLSDLDQIIEKHRKAGLPIPVNEWNISQNDDWTPGDLEGDIIKPNPSYTPPKKLPQPVNDWDE